MWFDSSIILYKLTLCTGKKHPAVTFTPLPWLSLSFFDRPAWKYPWQGNFKGIQLTETINIRSREAAQMGEPPQLTVDSIDVATAGLVKLMKELRKHSYVNNAFQGRVKVVIVT